MDIYMTNTYSMVSVLPYAPTENPNVPGHVSCFRKFHISPKATKTTIVYFAASVQLNHFVHKTVKFAWIALIFYKEYIIVVVSSVAEVKVLILYTKGYHA